MKHSGAHNALEQTMHLVFLLFGVVTIGFVLLISIYLIAAGLPAIREIGLVDFLFGKTWASTAAEPKFGILPFILTSIYGTAGAILIGVPVGFMTAVFLAKVAPRPLAGLVRPAVDLLAGIPSVVYGLVGMIILVPAIRTAFGLADGACLLAAIVVLAIMILPSIISVSETALNAVPKEYEEASLALGATEIETYFRVSVPAAKSGIAASIVLGIGRAIGEAAGALFHRPGALPLHYAHQCHPQRAPEAEQGEVRTWIWKSSPAHESSMTRPCAACSISAPFSPVPCWCS